MCFPQCFQFMCINAFNILVKFFFYNDAFGANFVMLLLMGNIANVHTVDSFQLNWYRLKVVSGLTASIYISKWKWKKNTSIRTENDLFQKQQQQLWAVRSLNRWNFKIHVFENRAIDSSNKRVIPFYPNRTFRAWVFKCGLVFISCHMFAHNK